MFGQSFPTELLRYSIRESEVPLVVGVKVLHVYAVMRGVATGQAWLTFAWDRPGGMGALIKVYILVYGGKEFVRTPHELVVFICAAETKKRMHLYL